MVAALTAGNPATGRSRRRQPRFRLVADEPPRLEYRTAPAAQLETKGQRPLLAEKVETVTGPYRIRIPETPMKLGGKYGWPRFPESPRDFVVLSPSVSGPEPMKTISVEEPRNGNE